MTYGAAGNALRHVLRMGQANKRHNNPDQNLFNLNAAAYPLGERKKQENKG